MSPGNRLISLISLPGYTILVCLMMQQVLVQNDHYHSVKKHAYLIPITDEVQGSKSERRNITLYAENDSAFRISWRNITCLFYWLHGVIHEPNVCLPDPNKKDVPVGVSKPGSMSMVCVFQQHGRCILCNLGLEEIYHHIWYFKLIEVLSMTVAQHQAMTMCSW